MVVFMDRDSVMTDDPKTVIERVRAWQANGMVHPLTCGNDSSHAKLVPVEADGKVILTCSDCDYRQDWIPNIVLGKPTPGAIKWP